MLENFTLLYIMLLSFNILGKDANIHVTLQLRGRGSWQLVPRIREQLLK